MRARTIRPSLEEHESTGGSPVAPGRRHGHPPEAADSGARRSGGSRRRLARGRASRRGADARPRWRPNELRRGKRAPRFASNRRDGAKDPTETAGRRCQGRDEPASRRERQAGAAAECAQGQAAGAEPAGATGQTRPGRRRFELGQWHTEAGVCLASPRAAAAELAPDREPAAAPAGSGAATAAASHAPGSGSPHAARSFGSDHDADGVGPGRNRSRAALMRAQVSPRRCPSAVTDCRRVEESMGTQGIQCATARGGPPQRPAPTGPAR
jgi:hypothetical protein